MSFFADLFGGKSGVRAANEAADAQRASTRAAYAGARQQAGQGYDTADNILSGYEAPARRANDLYADSLGVYGAEGGQRAQTAYQSARNPYLQYEQDQASQALNRQNNAGGMRWSGANAAAVARARMGLGYQDNQNWQNRLMQFGNQGMQIGGQRAGMAVDRGNQFAGYDIAENTGYGNTEVQRLGNIQQERAGGKNSLMKGIGTIAGLAAAPMTGGGSLIGMGFNKLMSGMGGSGGTPVGWNTTYLRG